MYQLHGILRRAKPYNYSYFTLNGYHRSLYNGAGSRPWALLREQKIKIVPQIKVAWYVRKGDGVSFGQQLPVSRSEPSTAAHELAGEKESPSQYTSTEFDYTRIRAFKEVKDRQI